MDKKGKWSVKHGKVEDLTFWRSHLVERYKDMDSVPHRASLSISTCPRFLRSLSPPFSCALTAPLPTKHLLVAIFTPWPLLSSIPSPRKRIQYLVSPPATTTYTAVARTRVSPYVFHCTTFRQRVRADSESVGLQVWDSRTYTLRTQLRGHTGSVLALEYASDKHWLFSSSGVFCVYFTISANHRIDHRRQLRPRW